MFNSSSIDKFINQLNSKVEKVETNLIKALEQSLELVEQTSQSYVPIKTKDLKNSFFTNLVKHKNKIIAEAGYDENGSLSHYAIIMHEGFWPSDYWDGNQARLNGTAINYHTTYQPTPRSHFLLLGFKENETKINNLLKGVFNGL